MSEVNLKDINIEEALKIIKTAKALEKALKDAGLVAEEKEPGDITKRVEEKINTMFAEREKNLLSAIDERIKELERKLEEKKGFL